MPFLLSTVLGFLIDKFGLRLVNLLSTLMNFTGLLLYAFLSPSSAVIIFIASTLSGVGGCGMITCALSASKLFTKTASMVTTIIQGVFDSSSVIFTLVYLTHEANFPFKSSFLILAIICLVSGVSNSLFVMSYWMEDMMKYRGNFNRSIRSESEVDIYELNKFRVAINLLMYYW